MIPGSPTSQIWKPNYGLQGYFPQGSMGEGAPVSRMVIVGCANATALGTIAIAQNFLYAIPQVFPKEVVISAVNINVTANVGGTNGRIGIYSNKSNHIPAPDKLLFDSGSIATTSNGVKTVLCGLTLAPGLYWFTYVASGATTATIRGVAIAGLSNTPSIPIGMGTVVDSGWTTAFTFGALPYAFPNANPLGNGFPSPAIGLTLQYDTR